MIARVGVLPKDNYLTLSKGVLLKALKISAFLGYMRAPRFLLFQKFAQFCHVGFLKFILQKH
jgi:hypothetical protein